MRLAIVCKLKTIGLKINTKYGKELQLNGAGLVCAQLVQQPAHEQIMILLERTMARWEDEDHDSLWEVAESRLVSAM